MFSKRAIRDNGHVYSSKYAGWYCVSDETFLTDSQLKEAPAARTGEMIKVSAESGHPVEWTEEQNYMFGLSKLADQVKQWILKGTCAFFRVHLQRLARCRRKWQSGG